MKNRCCKWVVALLIALIVMVRAANVLGVWFLLLGTGLSKESVRDYVKLL
jgi:hypothetical protein